MTPADIVPNPLDKARLAEVGRYLYGHPTQWQSAMARDLLCGSVDTVANWASGRRAVPGPAVAALRGMVRERQLKEVFG